MKTKLHNERGAALIIVLALMAMLAGVAIMSVDRSTTDVEMSYNQLHEEQAFYVAEAGAQKAFLKLDQDRSWRSGYTDEAIGDGTYSVVVLDSFDIPALAESLMVISEGIVDNAKATIELTLIPTLFSPFKTAMFAESHIEVKNSFCTDSYNSDSGSFASTFLDSLGDLGTNGTIEIKNAADIGGSVSSSTEGGLTINVGASITGDTTSQAPVTELPDIPEYIYDMAQADNDNISGMSGSYSYSSTDYAFSTSGTVTFTSGVYYFESFALFSGSEVIIPPGDEVVIYVRGDVEIKNSGEVNADNPPSSLQIFSTGNLILKNSADFYGLLYAPDAEVDLRNSADFYGSVVADDILNHNSACFHYDRDLGTIQWERDTGVTRISWKESY